MSEDWQKVKEIFQTAAAMDTSARNEFLKKATIGNTTLRSEVESLLNFHDRSDDFIEESAFGVAAEVLIRTDECSMIGRRIDSYSIKREIGHGGMGAVYLAERDDGAFEQKVALKIVKRGMDTDAILKRFVMERQILADLEHPFIAHLVDGGVTDENLPFLVMEYVDGVRIDEFCETNELSIDSRLDLFIKVCNAVEFAHKNGVVHRDLKPSNILVTENGTPKLLDFGIAKLLATAGETATQFQIFTPEYASPEQLRGESITTATDIYGLGVLLYELLTGETPFKPATDNPREVERLICDSQPLRPSAVSLSGRTRLGLNRETADEQRSALERTFASELKGDLDNIVLKALEKEPEDRYSSAAEFAKDIRRHREGLPIAARPASIAYRAAKLLKRNRALSYALGSLALVILLGTGALSWQAAAKQSEKAKAERRMSDTRALATTTLERQAELAKLSGTMEIRKKLIEDAIGQLDLLSAESGGDGSLQTEIAAAYVQMGDIQGQPFAANLGDSEASKKSYEKARSTLEDLRNSGKGNADIDKSLSLAIQGIGNIELRKARPELAIEHHQQALELRENLLANEPGDVLIRSLTADSYLNLADGFAVLANVKQDDPTFDQNSSWNARFDAQQKALQIYEQLKIENPGDVKANFGLAKSFQRIGYTYQRKGQMENETLPGSGAASLKETLAYYDRTTAIHNEILALDPSNAKALRNRADQYLMRGEAYAFSNQDAAAIGSYQRSIEMFTELSLREPANNELKRDLVNAYEYTARQLVKVGRDPDAIEKYRLAFDLLRQIVDADPEVTIEEAYLANNGTRQAELFQKTNDWQSVADVYQAILPASMAFADSPNAMPRFKENVVGYMHEIAKAHRNAAKHGTHETREKNIRESLKWLQDIRTLLQNEADPQRISENFAASKMSAVDAEIAECEAALK
ncbi:MAG: protein kinase [Acidobacteria bacterium]|nr:protein kinase [Acidobacteriota bacterium]